MCTEEDIYIFSCLLYYILALSSLLQNPPLLPEIFCRSLLIKVNIIAENTINASPPSLVNATSVKKTPATMLFLMSHYCRMLSASHLLKLNINLPVKEDLLIARQLRLKSLFYQRSHCKSQSAFSSRNADDSLRFTNLAFS